MNIRHYNRRTGVHKLYTGIDKTGKTMTLSALNKRDAAADMRKKGFRPLKIFQT